MPIPRLPASRLANSTPRNHVNRRIPALLDRRQQLSKKQCACVFATVLATCCTEAPALSAGTAFTYQGRLKLDGALVNSPADFEFSLWDAATGGNQIGATAVANAVNIANGVFTVELDFGVGGFNGDARWLEIAVSVPAGSGLLAQWLTVISRTSHA